MSDTCAALPEKPEAQLVLPRTIHLIPMDYIAGFAVRRAFMRPTAPPPSPAA